MRRSASTSGSRRARARAAAGRGGPAQETAPRKPARGRGGGRRVGAITRLKAYGVNHLQTLSHSLGRMAGQPVSSLMTVAVIGIALALPTGLHVLLKNVQAVSAGWESAAQISLFLKKQLSEEAVARTLNELAAMPEIASVNHISPAQALAEFQQLSGFDNAMDALQVNPLPTVIVVQPALEHSAPAEVETLLERLRGRTDVDLAQLDMEWVKRLYAMMEIGKRGVLVLGTLLALAVLLIVGNTIRLAIQNRREEIEVQKLIGATDAFIRRPFLYSGYWHGLLGAVFAWLLVNISLWLLDGPVRRFSMLYDSRFEIGALDLGASVALLALGVGLGLVGAWLAVGRHLREIEPA